MRKLSLAILVSLFAAGAYAADDNSCEAKAVSKSGKPLAGAAKAAFMKKCEKDAKDAAPAATDGKTEQQSKMKMCNADAKDKKGDERKAFMKECLKKK